VVRVKIGWCWWIMTTQNDDLIIEPETKLERLIVESDAFAQATSFVTGKTPQKSRILGIHVKRMLEYIDLTGFDSYRSELRILTLLHDICKPKSGYTIVNNKRVKLNHAELSYRFSKDFIFDRRDLRFIIRYHDHSKKLHGISKRERKYLIDKKHFAQIYSGLDLGLLIRFSYVDVCEREKDKVVWLEDNLYEYKYTKERIYAMQPKVLKYYNELKPKKK